MNEQKDKVKSSTKVMQYIFGGLLFITLGMGLLSAFFSDDNSQESTGSSDYSEHQEQNPF